MSTITSLFASVTAAGQPTDCNGPSLLRGWLQYAVPEWFGRYQFLPENERDDRLRQLRVELRSDKRVGGSDSFEGLVVGDTPSDETAMLIAKGLALLSFCPGGVDFIGLHFDAVEMRQRWCEQVEADWRMTPDELEAAGEAS